MGADFSRIRLNPLLDYAGVELKQGAVLLDADANELMGIVDRRLRALASDTLGRATVSSTTPDAFKLTVAAGTLQIGKGRLYVDGLLAENHGALQAKPPQPMFDPLLAETQFGDPVTYTTQPYLPIAGDLLADPTLPVADPLPTAGRHLVYLDVWDREVTHLEQSDLVESAVGVETSSRVQTVWQVRVLSQDVKAATCATPDADLANWSDVIAPSTGVLTTGTFEVAPVDDPCELPPTGGYRGLENQLYRVEIHDPGLPGKATFKWSRENASVGSRVANMISASELELETLGRDDVLRFNTGDWVEITDNVREFAQIAGEMRKITVNDATRRIQLSSALPNNMLPKSKTFPDSNFPRVRHMRVRRWEHKGIVFRTDSSQKPVQVQDLGAPNSAGVINVPAATTELLLENGVTVRFDSTGAKGFRAGDYWVFAARTADATVELLDRAPPRGIHHHYARLGIWDVAAGSVSDCRNPWPPRGDGHDCSCTACVTPESHASGHLTIQAAVDQVRATGGTVCLAPGQYPLKEPVRVTNASSVRVHGHGPTTVITCPGGAFALENCLAVAIEDLTILAQGAQSAITVRTVLGLALRRLVLSLLSTNDRVGAAISLHGFVAGASICDNAIISATGIMADDPVAVPPAAGEDTPAKFLVAAALAVERNLLWCHDQAVMLEGTVVHLMGTRFIENEVLGCRNTAISTLGLGAPGSSLTVSRNSFAITGNGIRSSLDGVWIDNNKLFNSGPVPDQRVVFTQGIALVTGSLKTGAERCQILANQISGFVGAGIILQSPTRELIVKLNIVENCGNGIYSTDSADRGSVSIENNHLRNIGPTAQGSTAQVVGVGVVHAESATIANNIIRTLGVAAPQSSLRAAILTIGVARARVSGNEVTEVAPPGDFIGSAVGIMLQPPYAQFEIHHNQVQRDAAPSTQASNGTWQALVAAEPDPTAPVARTGEIATVRLDDARVLVFNTGRAFVSGIAAATIGNLAAPAADPARGSVLGNVLSARGLAPAVKLSAGGECLFNDNRVESRLNTGQPAVIVSTAIAIVNANRVRGGEASIRVDGTKTAAVVGNITTGPILVSGGALQPPWNTLNLVA